MKALPKPSTVDGYVTRAGLVGRHRPGKTAAVRRAGGCAPWRKRPQRRSHATDEVSILAQSQLLKPRPSWPAPWVTTRVAATADAARELEWQSRCVSVGRCGWVGEGSVDPAQGGRSAREWEVDGVRDRRRRGARRSPSHWGSRIELARTRKASCRAAKGVILDVAQRRQVGRGRPPAGSRRRRGRGEPLALPAEVVVMADGRKARLSRQSVPSGPAPAECGPEATGRSPRSSVESRSRSGSAGHLILEVVLDLLNLKRDGSDGMSSSENTRSVRERNGRMPEVRPGHDPGSLGGGAEHSPAK